MLSVPRLALVAALIAVSFAPVLYSLGALAVTSDGTVWQDVFYRPFYETLQRTFYLLGVSVACTIPLSLGLTQLFIGQSRRLTLSLVSLLMLPLLIPPFFWSIGFQNLSPLLPYEIRTWVDGLSGSVLSVTLCSFPFSVIGVFISRSITSGAASDASLVFSGVDKARRLECWKSFPALVGGALIGAILALGDGGLGNITGYHTLATDIVVALSAKNDPQLALARAIWGFLCFVPFIVVAMVLLSRGFDTRELGKASLHSSRCRLRGRGAFALGMALMCAILAVPIYGLLRPLLKGGSTEAFKEAQLLFSETQITTIQYALAAATSACLIGLVLVALVPRSRRTTKFLILLAFLSLLVPASVNALGIVTMRSLSQWLQDLTAHTPIIAAAHGLRFAPLVALLLHSHWIQIPDSTLSSVKVHSVRRFTRVFVCYLPAMFGCIILVAAIVGVMAVSDTSSTMLLQIPGEATYGNSLFARMDNSSERLVSAMCFLYGVPSALFSMGLFLFTLNPFKPLK